MLDGLVFGWRSASLLAGLLLVAILAVALMGSMRNRVANRTLGVLLMVLVGVAAPSLIGFAGYYDRRSWLSHVPFSVNVAVPPLLWLFAHAFAHGRWPDWAIWHLAPARQAAARAYR